MIRIVLIGLVVLIAAASIMSPEHTKALFPEGGLTPVSLIIYLIGAAIFSWVVMQIWNVASIILKFAVIVACAAFLGIAMITMFDNKAANNQVNNTETEASVTTSENRAKKPVAASTQPLSSAATQTTTEVIEEENEEEENLSIFQRIKRKFFISDSQVEKAKQKRKEDEAAKKKARELQILARQQRHQARQPVKQQKPPKTQTPAPAAPSPIGISGTLATSANQIKQAVQNSVVPKTTPTPIPTATTAPKAPAYNIVYDKKGQPIGKLGRNGNFKPFGKEEAAAVLRIVNAKDSKKPHTSTTANQSGIKQSNKSSQTRTLTPKQAAKIDKMPIKPEPANPDDNAFNPPPEIAPSSDVITGVGTAVSGDTLELNGHWVTLFAIDSPHLNQQCDKFTGERYACGMSSKRKLELILRDQKITCKALAKTASGDYLAVCSDGQNDLASVMVRTGWALAYKESSDIYIPYENLAKREGFGVWQGRFQKPWEVKK